MAMLNPIQGRDGWFNIDGLPGVEIELAKYRHGGVMDAVQPTSLTPAGQDLQFFQNVAKQFGIYRTFTTPGKIRAKTELILNRIGVHFHAAFGGTLVPDSDILQAMYGSGLLVKFSQNRTLCEGPAYEFPYGKGPAGTTTRGATGIVTNGVAARSATEELLVAQPLDNSDTIEASLRFNNNATFPASAAALTLSVLGPISLHLDGLEKYTE